MSEQTQDNANLTINDLKTIISVVDLATQRGAFRANELKTVGTVYEKVQAFLAQVEGQMKAQAEAQKPADPAQEAAPAEKQGEKNE
tara:strand:+ start:663 stop:920 length:258 start_codon:yes stop_codon:yes gene_type:complete